MIQAKSCYFFIFMSFKVLKVLPYLLCSLLFVQSCDDDDAREAQFQAKVERTRTVLANHCTQDSDCIITGCHQTMCRAMPEPEYCDHRIVLAIDDTSDIGIIKSLVTDQLTVRESETVRLGGYATGRWTLSFQATEAQRMRVETALEQLTHSGFARLHPKAQQHTQAIYAQLTKSDPDITLKSMKGAGNLVEKKIRSGDMLSKDDVRAAWTQVASIHDIKISENDDIERLWAYDVIFETIAQLRLWPIDKRQRISARFWTDFNYRIDNGDILISATLAEPVVPTFEAWTSEEKLITLMLGNEIIASALPKQAIQDGRFEIVIHHAAHSETILNAIETLKAISEMKGTVRIDKDATAKVERDITCHRKHPRECACIEGSCGWRMNIDYNACLYEN